MAACLASEFLTILVSTRGSVVNRVDGLINATLILSALALYTALQLERSKRNWRRICDSESTALDLKLTGFRQWFNPIVIGPKLELSSEISSAFSGF